ncbi:hypothetical protein [Streptomyces griseosporeus]|uniref:hypothetical protein n=1 Tax=Streptomyces griseosporeus TaxID=1910 RepID=UPI0036FE4651
MTDTDTSPLVLHGRRRSVARLRSGVLMLDEGRTRRRVPVAAIERVETGGRGGRELTVVLTAPAPPAVTYTLTARSAPMVREFAAALRRAVPVRDADEPRPDGAALVWREDEPEPARPERGVWPAIALVGAFLAVPCVLWFGRGRGLPAVLWVLSPPAFLIGWAAMVGGWEVRGKASALRTRGLTVEGRLESTYEERSGEQTETKYVYVFADVHGREHRYDGPRGRGAAQVEIVYDPADPDGNHKVGRGTAVRSAWGWLLVLLLGLPGLAAAAGLAVMAVVALFR